MGRTRQTVDLMTATELIAFEAEVAEMFNQGRIRAPCHLSGGNESQLIEIFKGIARGDYVLSNYRWHYHALLHGIPREKVIAELLAGKGMNMASVDSAIRMAQAQKDKPSLIICRTGIVYGSPNKAGTGAAHGEPLGADEVRLA